jgi:hypothetical protein
MIQPPNISSEMTTIASLPCSVLGVELGPPLNRLKPFRFLFGNPKTIRDWQTRLKTRRRQWRLAIKNQPVIWLRRKWGFLGVSSVRCLFLRGAGKTVAC